jgi:DNA transformation protein
MSKNILPDLLEKLPGLGPKSRDMLRKAGILSPAQLQEIGSVNAYLLVKRADGKASLNLLWGLESALTGEHWRDVAKNHRVSLLLALEEQEKHLL